MNLGKRLLALLIASSGITYCYWGIDWAIYAVAEGRMVQLPTPFGYWQVDPWVWWGLNYYLMMPCIGAAVWLAYSIGRNSGFKAKNVSHETDS